MKSLMGRSVWIWVLLAAFAAGSGGCTPNHEEVSSTYKQLPPSEAAKRLQEVLKKRGQTRDLSQPAPGAPKTNSN